MTPLRSRILTAPPHTWHTRLEIAKAIRELVAQDEEARLQRRAELAAIRSDCEDIAEALREACCEVASVLRSELRKAGYNPNEPRVPVGNSGGGRWTTEGGNGTSNDPRILSDATPDNTWERGAQYAANIPPSVGSNQSPPLGPPPEIPPEEPPTAKAVNTFLKAAAYWLAGAALAGEPAGDFILALEAAEWLYEFLPYIDAYLDPPKTWEELQRNALSPQAGYDIHHPVEQTSAAQDGFSPDEIDAPENRLLIPTLKHWLINAWYSRPNPDFGDFSPRDYLRGKDWAERVRVGKMALTLYGVLQP
jgi:hypothetical protein